MDSKSDPASPVPITKNGPVQTIVLKGVLVKILGSARILQQMVFMLS